VAFYRPQALRPTARRRARLRKRPTPPTTPSASRLRDPSRFNLHPTDKGMRPIQRFDSPGVLC
jgi:hypothetical protein